LIAKVPPGDSPFLGARVLIAEAFLKGSLFIDGAQRSRETSYQLTLSNLLTWWQPSSLQQWLTLATSWFLTPDDLPQRSKASPFPCCAGRPSQERRGCPGLGPIIPRPLAPPSCRVARLGLLGVRDWKKHTYLSVSPR